MKLINFFKIFCMKWVSFYCRWQEEPAILISMLLHCVFCTTVCSQHLFGLPLRMDGMHRTQFDHLHLDLLSLVIWSCMLWPSDHMKHAQQQHALELKPFGLWSLSPALRNVWLLLVTYYFSCLQTVILLLKWVIFFFADEEGFDEIRFAAYRSAAKLLFVQSKTNCKT